MPQLWESRLIAPPPANSSSLHIHEVELGVAVIIQLYDCSANLFGVSQNEEDINTGLVR